MGIFIVTFRIYDDAGYADRYQSVVEQIKKCCHDGIFWDQTTSFFVLKNPSTAEKIAEYIDANSTFSPTRDLLVVIALSQKDHAVIGNITDTDLHKLMALR